MPKVKLVREYYFWEGVGVERAHGMAQPHSFVKLQAENFNVASLWMNFRLLHTHYTFVLCSFVLV